MVSRHETFFFNWNKLSVCSFFSSKASLTLHMSISSHLHLRAYYTLQEYGPSNMHSDQLPVTFLPLASGRVPFEMRYIVVNLNLTVFKIRQIRVFRSCSFLVFSCAILTTDLSCLTFFHGSFNIISVFNISRSKFNFCSLHALRVNVLYLPFLQLFYLSGCTSLAISE